MAIVYYEDDYSVKVEIPEKNGMPAFELAYRPMNMIEAARYTEAVTKAKTIEETVQVGIKLISKHVVSWSLQKPNGNAVDAKNTSEIGRLDPRIVNSVLSAIRGEDTTPEADKKALDDELKN